MGFTIVFISDDLSVVRYISDRIMVMNKSKDREEIVGGAEQVYFVPSEGGVYETVDCFYSQKEILSLWFEGL